jgi:hypothetical protein
MTQQLTSNVFVETLVRGCNHGFVITSDGIVMIDRPHKPSDGLYLVGMHRAGTRASASSIVLQR